MKYFLGVVFLCVAIPEDSNNGVHGWNISSESWLDYHMRKCGGFCMENKLYGKSSFPCFTCDCGPLCYVYDTCCPTKVNNVYVEPLRRQVTHLPRSDMFQCSAVYDDKDMYWEESYYYTISDCDPKFSENMTKVSDTVLNLLDQCRDPDTKTMDDVTPYSDMYYGIVYKNKFCALCNGYTVLDNVTGDTNINISVKIARPWSVEITCEHFQNLYHLTSDYEVYKRADNIHGTCFAISRRPSSQYAPQKCTNSLFVDREENCTSESTLLHEFCRNITGRSLTFGPYPNIFCAICAGQTYFPNPVPQGSRPNPLSVLLSLTLRVSRREEERCPLSSDWKGPDGKCRNASCSPGKTITAEGHCVTALRAIRGLGYRLEMTLLPINEVTLTKFDFHPFHKAIYGRLCSGGNDVELNTAFAVRKTSKHRYYVINSLKVLAYIVANRSLPRDDWEQKMLQMINNTWNVTIEHYDRESRSNPTLSFRPILLGNKMKLIYETVGDSTTLRYTDYSFSYERIWALRNKFIDITYSLVCPHVEINVSRQTVVDFEIHITFDYGGRSYTVKDGAGISFVKRRWSICVDKFRTITEEKESLLVIILYYFQVVCLSVSVACLILSLVTYFLFTSLRSLPGLNNISLCVSLATAQISLLVVVEYGVQGRLASGFCMLNAILLHFSWLASFAWMSACCVHMYLVFTSVTVHRNVGALDIRRRHFRYCIYGYGAPTLIVMLTLTLNAVITSGASVGYDDNICFLDTRTSVLTVVLSLLVPLCAMVISNGVLFTLTLREMVSVAEVQRSATVKERRGVMTYVKLSTLTGISCVISAVAVWVGNDILQLITCPLMALQGLFIFFSFIFNKRVGKMYYDLFRLHRFGFIFTTGDISEQTTNSGESSANQKAVFSTHSTDI